MTKPEPLKNKVYDCECFNFAETEDEVVEIVKLEDVKAAVEFYKKYRDDGYLEFKKTFPETWDEYKNCKLIWNDWLLNIAFQDVIE